MTIFSTVPHAKPTTTQAAAYDPPWPLRVLPHMTVPPTGVAAPGAPVGKHPATTDKDKGDGTTLWSTSSP